MNHVTIIEQEKDQRLKSTDNDLNNHSIDKSSQNETLINQPMRIAIPVIPFKN